MYGKIQWLAETLYDEGYVQFYESCMLESIKNAIHKYTLMGVLERVEVKKKRGTPEVYYVISTNFKDAK